MVKHQKYFYEEYWQHRKKTGYIYDEKHLPPRFSIIISLIGSGKRILDIGCGEGLLCKLLMEKGNEVIGIDISDNAVELAKRNGINAFVCDVENEALPFEGFFDVIILSEVLEHLISPKKVIKKLMVYLKPKDGYFVITFPNIAHYTYRIQLLCGHFPKQYLLNRDEHLHYWSIPDFTRFLIDCGLKCVKIKPVFLFPFHSLISKILPLKILLEKFPNLFGYQIVIVALPQVSTIFSGRKIDRKVI